MSQFYASYPHLLAPPPNSGGGAGARPRVPSQLGQSSSSSQPQPQASASTSGLGLGGKLRSMLDRQKYAIFQIDLTLHELGNVPQLEGEFAVRWRFRGKRPKARDAVHRLHTPHAPPTPKPSLPNLKLTYANSIHPSSSSASIRSSSTGGTAGTGGTGESASIRSIPVPVTTQGNGKGKGKGKSMSTPPIPLPMTAKRVDKKGSDPTPLRNSLSSTVNDSTADLVSVESPSPVDSTPTSDRDRGWRGGSSTPMAGPSRSSTLPPTHPLATASASATPTPVSNRSLAPSTAPSSASSSTSLLSVPQALGAGMERTPSASASTRTGGSSDQASLGVRNGDRPLIRRIRSNSGSSMVHSAAGVAAAGGGTGAGVGGSGSGKVSARRGVTPGRPLKSHTCTWDHDLSLSLRLPISKSSPPTGSRAQVLGDGSESASGLQLIIEQLPTASATSAAHAKASDPNLRRTAQGQAQGQAQAQGERKSSGERTVFGKVDIDLAAFAGRGKTTRKFLLHGSRTNATVKITVEMTFMGGEKNWVAPPLQEGHHVTQQLKEIMGGRDAGQDLERDLQLVKTPSGSSSGSATGKSSISISRTHSSKSRNASSASLVNNNNNNNNNSLARAPSSSAAPRPQYKTYDHHLLSPDDARRDPSAPASAGAEHRSRSRSKDEDSTTGSRTTFSFHRHHHHHHRHLRLPHHHRHGHERQHRTQGITELPAEAVIEHIFNPFESHEEGPFTFLPNPAAASASGPEVTVAVLQEDEEHHEHAPGVGHRKEKEHKLGGGGGWRRRPKTPAMSRTASGLGVVMGAASGTAGGTLGVSARPASVGSRVASAAH